MQISRPSSKGGRTPLADAFKICDASAVRQTAIRFGVTFYMAAEGLLCEQLSEVNAADIVGLGVP